MFRGNGTLAALSKKIGALKQRGTNFFRKAHGPIFHWIQITRMDAPMSTNRNQTNTLPRCVVRALSAPAGAPVLMMDLDVVDARFERLSRGLGGAGIYYAVKANPTPDVVARLVSQGARMDIASKGELEICRSAGVEPRSISFGNTIKRPEDIQAAFEAGVRRFSADTSDEIDKIAGLAPGAEVLLRISVEDSGAAYPLGEKFGCTCDEAVAGLARASSMGLVPAGISFHVGSQASDPSSWREATRSAATVIARGRSLGLPVRVLNIGGGFPATAGDEDRVEGHAAQVREIVLEETACLSEGIEIMAEPGRGLVADAGAIAATVVSATWRRGQRWVYLDIGRFSGLAETEGEFARYPLVTLYGPDEPASPAIVAGPTCDSADVLWRQNLPVLPDCLKCGDRLVIVGTGAYTGSYASVGFNGFPPLGTQCFTTKA